MTFARRSKSDTEWIGNWIDSVQTGKVTMSQRSASSIEAHGGLDAAIEAARAKGVHLVQLTGEKGKIVVAASREPFRALC